MPKFTYTGDDERYYPSLGLTVTPGDDHALDEDPGDGRWTSDGSAPSTPPAAPPADDPTPDEHDTDNNPPADPSV